MACTRVVSRTASSSAKRSPACLQISLTCSPSRRNISEQAEQAWVQTILKTGESRRKLLETCTPGYYNNEGRLSQAVAQALSFGAGPVAFIELLREWRAAGDLAGLELDKTKLPATLDA